MKTLISAVLAAVLVVGTVPASAGRLPAGTEMVVRLQTDIEPGNQNSDHFAALITYPIFADGREVVPAGSRVEGDVRGSKKSIVLSPKYLYLPDGKRLDFNAAVSDIDRKKLKAEEREGTIEQSGSKADAARQAAEIGMTGAGIGAMATGSAKGMGIGAAIGVAAVLIGRKMAGRGGSDSIIPAGTQLTLSLSRELDLPDNLSEAAIQAPPTSNDPDRPVLRRRE